MSKKTPALVTSPEPIDTGWILEEDLWRMYRRLHTYEALFLPVNGGAR